MNVEQDVLRKIRPTEEDRARIKKAADDLHDAVQAYIDKESIDAEIRFAGSYSKDTYLADPDIDLFVMFPPSLPREDLVRIGLKMGEDVLHGERMFAEHPYTTGKYEGVDVDLVPCYHLDGLDRIQSAVDRTPFHTQFVLDNMSLGQRDEVRLLKKFMKGIGAYGAEPNTRGFSGYLCELLVIKYGTFDGVLQAAASDWKEGTSIEIRERGPPMIGPLIVYDPVDKKRNVASAVHLDTLALFITAAKDYLAKPSEKFFFPVERKPLSAEMLDEIASVHGSRILTVTFRRPDVIEENLWSQLWKTQYALAKKLDDFDFNVLRAVHGLENDTMTIAFELDRDVLSKTYKHIGPPGLGQGRRRLPPEMEEQRVRGAVHRGWLVVRDRGEDVLLGGRDAPGGGIPRGHREGDGPRYHEDQGPRGVHRGRRQGPPDRAHGPHAPLEGRVTAFRTGSGENYRFYRPGGNPGLTRILRKTLLIKKIKGPDTRPRSCASVERGVDEDDADTEGQDQEDQIVYCQALPVHEVDPYAHRTVELLHDGHEREDDDRADHGRHNVVERLADERRDHSDDDGEDDGDQEDLGSIDGLEDELLLVEVAGGEAVLLLLLFLD
nr:CCA tRNA nucleotidyltransferase [Candidatus Methanomethylophilus sp. 1R26]